MSAETIMLIATLVITCLIAIAQMFIAPVIGWVLIQIISHGNRLTHLEIFEATIQGDLVDIKKTLGEINHLLRLKRRSDD